MNNIEKRLKQNKMGFEFLDVISQDIIINLLTNGHVERFDSNGEWKRAFSIDRINGRNTIFRIVPTYDPEEEKWEYGTVLKVGCPVLKRCMYRFEINDCGGYALSLAPSVAGFDGVEYRERLGVWRKEINMWIDKRGDLYGQPNSRKVPATPNRVRFLR